MTIPLWDSTLSRKNKDTISSQKHGICSKQLISIYKWIEIFKYRALKHRKCNFANPDKSDHSNCMLVDGEVAIKPNRSTWQDF